MRIVLTVFFVASFVAVAAEEECRPPTVLTLSDAEAFAIVSNPSLQALRSAVVQGNMRVLQAYGAWLPSAEWTGETRRTHILGRFDDIHTSMIAINQLLYSGDALYGVKLSGRDADIIYYEFVTLYNDILFQVRSAYYRLVLAREDIAVRRDNVELLVDAMEREKRRLEFGESTKFEVNRSKVAVSNALSGYYEAVKEENLARDALGQVLGIDPDDAERLELTETTIPVEEIALLAQKIDVFTPESETFFEEALVCDDGSGLGRCRERQVFSSDETAVWERQALRRRPDIRRYEVALAAAVDSVNKRRTEYLPVITIFTNRRDHSFGGFSSKRSFWEWGGNFQWKLFDGFARENRIREASSARCEALINYNKSIQDAKIALADRFHEIEQSLFSYFAEGQSVVLAEESVDQAKARRDVGTITSLEYRDATNALTVSRHRFNQTSYALLIAYYALVRDVGGEPPSLGAGS